MYTLVVARRDLGAYFASYAGWVILAVFLFFSGALFQAQGLGSGAKYSHEVLETFFYNTQGVLVVATLLLTMRTFAEERQMGTDVLLATSPASELQVVLGKYLATMGVVVVMLALSAYMPALIFVNGKVSVGHILTGYLGLFGMASAAAAIGIATSSVFRFQLAAGIVAGAIIGFLYVSWTLSDRADAPISDVLAYMAFFDKHFTPLHEGRLHVRDLVYYASLTFLGLLGSVKVIEGRRWL